LLAPACIVFFVLFISKDKKNIVKLLLVMAAAFIAGFSLYLYLPIRANMQPDFNWGNPYNLERMIWHITGKQFSVWIFSSKGSLPLFLVQILILIGFSLYGFQKRNKLSQLYHLGIFTGFFILTFLILTNSSDIVNTQYLRFLNSIVSEFGPGLFLFGVFGLIRLVKFNITIYYFTLLLFFGCLLYAVNYDIHDIDSYFILSFITVSIWMFFGAVYIYEQFLSFFKDNSKFIAAAIIALLFLVPLISNYELNDESNNYVVEEYTMNVFKNIEPNGIIISTQWDFWLSASWYYNIVKNIRRDIVVIDKELLRRSWYFKYLHKHYPEVYERSRTEIEKFLPELDKFEHDVPYDQRLINNAYLDVLTSFVAKNPDRKVYTTWEIEQNQQEPFAQSFTRIPDGLLFRLVKPENARNETIKVYDFQFSPLKNESYYHGTIIQTYNMMLTNSAYYLIQQNKIEEAKIYLAQALKAEPNNTKSLELKKKFNL
jgi:hypothetical protein